MKAVKSRSTEMLSRSSWSVKEVDETGHHQKKKKQTVKERVGQHIREDKAGFHCHIVGDSTCQYVQKKLRPDNFVRHFRDRHEFEAKEKGFQENNDEEEEEQTGSEPLVEAEPCPAEVRSDPMAVLRNQFPNMIFNINGVRKDWYKKLVRPWILEDEKGAHCRILDDASCRYTQKTLRLQNFLRHFRSVHEPEARQKGLFWDEYKDYAYTDNSENGLEQNIQNESQDEKTKRKTWYQIVKHFLLEDEKGIHCQVVVGDSICNYTQKTLQMQNMMRHFRIKHKQEAKDMEFLEDDPEQPSVAGLSQNATEEQLDGEMKSLKTEVQDSLLEGVLAEQDIQMPNCDFAVGDHVSASNKPSFKRSRKSRKKNGPTKTRRLMKFILQDQAGSHCRILDDLSCPYTQKTLHVQNFLRHFRSVHPAASRRNGFFWRSKENWIPQELPTESSAQESDGDGQERDKGVLCVKTEEFNVLERGLAQVDDDERIRCIIEPDSPCQYRQDCYDEVRFLAHFRLKHSYLEDVLFPGDGVTIPDQVDHAVVGEDGIFCQKEPDSGCDYFQTSYNEKKFRQHFRAKHSGQDEKEQKRPKKSGDIYRKLMQFIYEDDLGIHCRITDDTKCDYVQQTRQLQLFLRHFLLSHRKEARQKGLLTNPQSQLLKSIIPRYDRKGRIIIYQSYHLKKHGLVQAQDDGFRCSQEACDFVRDKYDESTFLEHLRQNHPTVFEGLKPSKQRLTFKVDEHVLQDEGGFHCRIAGPSVCNYVQRRFRMQNFFRHFYIRHRVDFDRTGFVLRHVNSYGTAKVQDLLENCAAEESDDDGEPIAAERSITTCDTFMDLELSVDQASNDEDEAYDFRHQPESKPSVSKRLWCAQRAKIDELVKVNDEGAFCCNISKKSGCDFVMPFFNRQPFAKHFRTKHPEEAKRHGFFDQFNLRRSKNSNNSKPMVGEYVALDERGFRCNINGKSHCSYVRKRLHEKAFLKHFGVRHPEEAKRYGLYDLVAKSRAHVRKGKRKRFLIDMIRENVMADSRGIHCRIADPLCDYVQEIYRPQNFQRHFIGKHPKEAMAKGFVAAEPEPEEQESTSGDESDDEALGNPAEYCRLCSSTVQPLEPIFKQLETIGNSLVPLIERFTGITLTIESDNSAHICEKCHQRLKNNQRFSQRCQSFDRKVRRKKKTDLPEPVCCSPSPLVPYNLDVVPVTVRPSVPFIGVESHGDDIGSAEQDMISLDIIKTEETVVEGMEQDPFVSSGSSGLEKVADVGDELPYGRVLNMLKCGHCELVCQTVAAMVEHCREVHGVQADDGR